MILLNVHSVVVPQCENEIILPPEIFVKTISVNWKRVILTIFRWSLTVTCFRCIVFCIWKFDVCVFLQHPKPCPICIPYFTKLYPTFISHKPFFKTEYSNCKQRKMMNHCLVTKHDLMPILGTQWEFRNKWNLKQCANLNFKRWLFVRLSIVYNSE